MFVLGFSGCTVPLTLKGELCCCRKTEKTKVRGTPLFLKINKTLCLRDAQPLIHRLIFSVRVQWTSETADASRCNVVCFYHISILFKQASVLEVCKYKPIILLSLWCFLFAASAESSFSIDLFKKDHRHIKDELLLLLIYFICKCIMFHSFSVSLS